MWCLQPCLLAFLVLCLLVPRTASLVYPTEFNGTDGTIYSPNYPQDYTNNLDMEFHVNVAIGHYVYFTLLDFETEGCCDKVTVFDGPDMNSPIIQNLSGVATGGTFKSSANHVTIMFHTDLTTTFRGFAIQYEAVLDNTNYVQSADCGNSLNTNGVGFIMSPNWPGVYPDNIACSYKIQSSLNRVSLTFVSFATEACCDIVELYDGSNIVAKRIARLSGSSLQNTTFTSSGPYLFLTFSTDLDNTMQGFNAFYNSI